MIKYIISINKRIVCTTTVPYPADVIKSMKKAGYKIKIEEE